MKFSLINALASALLFVGTVKAAPIDSRQMTPDYNPVISQVLETELKERQLTPDYNPVISQVLETELNERQLTPDYNPVICLLYTSPSPRDVEESRMPSSA